MVTLVEHLMYFLINGCNNSFPSSSELQRTYIASEFISVSLTHGALFVTESFRHLYESGPVHVLPLQAFQV